MVLRSSVGLTLWMNPKSDIHLLLCVLGKQFSIAITTIVVRDTVINNTARKWKHARLASFSCKSTCTSFFCVCQRYNDTSYRLGKTRSFVSHFQRVAQLLLRNSRSYCLAWNTYAACWQCYSIVGIFAVRFFTVFTVYFNVFARWHQRIRFKRWPCSGDRVGVWGWKL